MDIQMFALHTGAYMNSGTKCEAFWMRDFFQNKVSTLNMVSKSWLEGSLCSWYYKTDSYSLCITDSFLVLPEYITHPQGEVWELMKLY